jgi:carbamate kinase
MIRKREEKLTWSLHFRSFGPSFDNRRELGVRAHNKVDFAASNARALRKVVQSPSIARINEITAVVDPLLFVTCARDFSS